MLPDHPDIHVEIALDPVLTDILAGRFDAGVRLGQQLAKDMASVRIGSDTRMAVVGSPAYLAGRPRPRAPGDLTAHRCVTSASRPAAAFKPGSSRSGAAR